MRRVAMRPPELSKGVLHRAGAGLLVTGFRFVELANDINGHRPDYVVRRLLLTLNKRGRPMIGAPDTATGLAYKKDTGDTCGLPTRC
jgi:UDP-N-acetyl-D-mannosaminuronate dehydrogenase